MALPTSIGLTSSYCPFRWVLCLKLHSTFQCKCVLAVSSKRFCSLHLAELIKGVTSSASCNNDWHALPPSHHIARNGPCWYNASCISMSFVAFQLETMYFPFFP